MALKRFSPLLGAGIQDFFDPKNDIKEAVDTDAVIMKDTSGNKKWSIKHNTNIVKYDHYSPEPDNKLLNSGFETDLSNWSEVPSYTLNDQFTTDRAAGSVNGTSAEPLGGVRTVTDTNSKISITGRILNWATGQANNDGIWWSAITRVAGKIQLITATTTSGSTRWGYGVNTSTSNQAGIGIGAVLTLMNGGAGAAIGTTTNGTQYSYASILRAAGVMLFAKGGTEYPNWTLLWTGVTSAGASLVPAIQVVSASVVAVYDNIRIPTATWLPTEGVTYDTFA